jgi:hypothetical protein
MPKKSATTQTRDWKNTRALWIKTLENKTGRGLAYWNKRIAETNPLDKHSLQGWLKQEGVTGYAAQVLVMERFGYPDFIEASGAELIDAQYADRAQLRPIYDLIVAAAQGFGQVVVQARKGYVSLLSPRKTFARIQPTTKTRLDLGLLLAAQRPIRRLLPGKIHETMPVQMAFSSTHDFDGEAVKWLRKAYHEAQGK